MHKASARIQAMREQQLTRALRAVAVIGFFALLCSISRSFTVGWRNVMYLHIALYLVVLALAVWNRYFSYTCRAATIVIIPYLVGIGGLLTWGLAASGLISLFCFCILATITYGCRAGILACTLAIATVGGIGICAISGVLHFNFNAQEYLNSATTWITAMVSIALSAGVIVVVWGTLNIQVEDLVHTLAKQNEELKEKNLQLEREIHERIQAEENRKVLESKLQLARKMESIGKLAGGVAHDLNNTLGSVVGYPDLLLEELPSQSHLRETVETIKKSGIKAAAIVNDMLSLARTGMVATDVIDFNSVISEYYESPELRQLKAFHPNVAVDLQLTHESLNVRGSFFHLSKIIMNLVSNAAEAISDGGRILITTDKKFINGCISGQEEISEGEYAVLRVVDTGTGIPEGDLEKIFEPFYTKKIMGRSGTGLGMAVVWGSVKDHCGHITVESTEGTGTRITVYLPLTSEAPAARKLPFPLTTFQGNGESILVVDDLAEQREIASRILTRMGYSVKTAASGEEAIAYLRQTPVDLLIIDMLMEPGMDGLEAFKRIIEIRPKQKTLIATGFAETSKIDEASRLGVGGYLKKPYLLTQIGQAVRAELDKGRDSKKGLEGRWN
jgi:signal transduction histidine kinase/ActR/RegA family two-component response regulator